MPTLTKDEQLEKLDRQLEQLVNMTIRQNDRLTRFDAVRLIAQRAIKMSTQRKTRKIVEPLAIQTV